MQQAVHCIEEALASYERNEDPRHVRDDLVQAQRLIQHALTTVGEMAKTVGGDLGAASASASAGQGWGKEPESESVLGDAPGKERP